VGTRPIRMRLLLATIIGMLPILAMSQPVYALTFTERAVCTEAHGQTSPVVDGNRVVWADFREAAPAYSPITYTKNVRIRMKDVSTGSESFLSVNADGFTSGGPGISGNKVVWGSLYPGASSGGWIFFVGSYDIGTSVSKVLSGGYTAAISGNRVVYCPTLGGWMYVYDFGTGTDTKVNTGDFNNDEPSISGTRIAYSWKNQDQTTYQSQHDIWVYDLATNEDVEICGNTAEQARPDIFGTKVVWEDQRNGNWDIYMHDVATGQERRITSNAADQQHPSISGNRIVWEDQRNGNWDIYMYDLSTNTEQRVTYNTADQRSPDISGNRIVWTDYRNGNGDIYMADIGSAPVTVTAPAFATTRLRPNTAVAASGLLSPRHAAGAGSIQLQCFLNEGGTWVLEKTVTAVNSDYSTYTRYDASVSLPYVGSWRVRAYHPADAAGPAAYTGYTNVSVLLPLRLWIQPVAAPAYGAAARVTGHLVTDDGEMLPGRTIRIDRSTNGVSWTAAATVVTNASGAFAWTTPALATRVWYRPFFAGEAAYLSCTGAGVAVTPKAYLPASWVPAGITKNVAFTSAGYIKPRHVAGTYPVSLQFFHSERQTNGAYAWILRRSVSAKASDYLTYTRYSAATTLPYAGSWRVRAYHAADTANAATYSAYTTFSAR
jgi:beta propeller repeat protein